MKIKNSSTSGTLLTLNKKNPGVHSKKNTSILKSSKNYKKLYRSQGK